ncbi:hypothetical protein LOC68_22745 [Blastopirellula sp. JC732]|uniref:Uncharacterized protein n=1 Tax=Blastopirellula sediminis TaxID=2894196 RepID=A0A9X1MQV8_9BACT|nr:hypothetical protein [Blastopirellula sediminis]MCC9605479.1 hypothetical protein [Blastopirellula sediminis]MCC9631221.1 hypothetical protein [Blastopirellula sediminis]
MNDRQRTTPDLDELVRLFYDNPSELADFTEVSAAETPEPFKELLAHDHHMTVTVERFHQSPVDVQVLQTDTVGAAYSRKILLSKQTDGKVVQFGIVRLHCNHLSAIVEQEIKSERIPVGRVLINHNVLRQVQLTSLWRVVPGEELRDLLALEPGEVIYGRTALIFCDGEPAVELLEIVTP